MVRKVSAVLLLVSVLAVGAGTGSLLFLPLETVYNQIRNLYYWSDRVTEEELLTGAVKGLVESLDDPYCFVYTPEQYRNFRERISGASRYSGVGIEITIRGGRLTIVTAFDGTPAAAAGIRGGEAIIAVDGQPTAGWTLEDASSRIRGPEGTTVTLTVEHQDGTQRDVPIVRQTIEISSVRSEYIADARVGYVRIVLFDSLTAGLVAQALFSFPLSEMQGLVLDLRGNGGGLVDAVVETASHVIGRGREVVRLRSRSFDGRSFTERPYVSYRESIVNVPIAVLVNEGTASAGEIMAGAIQDHGLGVLIGQQTFGKGVATQFVMELPDGSAIQLVTSAWLTPKGREIHEVGLEPDIPIVRAEEQTDVELEVALDWIREQIGAPAGAGR